MKHHSIYFGFNLLISSLLNLGDFRYFWFLALNTDEKVKNQKMKQKRRFLCKNNLFNLTIPFNLSKILRTNRNELPEWKWLSTWEEEEAKKSMYLVFIYFMNIYMHIGSWKSFTFLLFASVHSIELAAGYT